jgi:predicted amidophosphoribosyltransferase
MGEPDAAPGRHTGSGLCPRCGTDSGGTPWCPRCGLRLRERSEERATADPIVNPGSAVSAELRQSPSRQASAIVGHWLP